MRALIVWLRELRDKIFGGIEPEGMAEALERFLRGEERRWDWDDYFGAPSAHRVVREVVKDLHAMGFDIPPDEQWRTDPALRGRIEAAIKRLRTEGTRDSKV